MLLRFVIALSLVVALTTATPQCTSCDTCKQPCECEGVELHLKAVSRAYLHIWTEARASASASAQSLGYSSSASYSSAKISKYVHAAAGSASFAASYSVELCAAVALSFGKIRCVHDYKVMVRALSYAHACASASANASAIAYSSAYASSEAAALAKSAAGAAAVSVAKSAACAKAAAGAAAAAYAEAFAHVYANCSFAYIELEVKSKVVVSAFAAAKACAIVAVDLAVKTGVYTKAIVGLEVQAHAYAASAADAATEVSTCASVYTDMLLSCNYDFVDYYLAEKDYYYIEVIDQLKDILKPEEVLASDAAITEVYRANRCHDIAYCDCEGVVGYKVNVSSSYSRTWIKVWSFIERTEEALVYSKVSAKSAATVAGYTHIATQASAQAASEAQSYSVAITLAFGEIRCLLSHKVFAEALSLAYACACAGAEASSYAFSLAKATASATAKATSCAHAASIAVAKARACAMAASAAASVAYAAVSVRAFGNCTHHEIEISAIAKTVVSAFVAAQTCAEVVAGAAVKVSACASTVAGIVVKAEVWAVAGARAATNASTCAFSFSSVFAKCKNTPYEYFKFFKTYELPDVNITLPKVKKFNLDLPTIFGDNNIRSPLKGGLGDLFDTFTDGWSTDIPLPPHPTTTKRTTTTKTTTPKTTTTRRTTTTQKSGLPCPYVPTGKPLKKCLKKLLKKCSKKAGCTSLSKKDKKKCETKYCRMFVYKFVNKLRG